MGLVKDTSGHAVHGPRCDLPTGTFRLRDGQLVQLS
jgi:hypothetical protein